MVGVPSDAGQLLERPRAETRVPALHPPGRAVPGDVRGAAELVHRLSSQGEEIYFACAEYSTSDGRTAANALGAYAFWLDIDCGATKVADGKGYEDVAAAQAYEDTSDPNDKARVRRVRIVRDYGKYDRREAPQYYADAKGGETLYA